MSATLDIVPPNLTDVATPVDTSALPAIRVRGLSKRYGAVEAVKAIDFDVAGGEIFGLIGPDGAGKTSTFQILGGVMPATGGEATVFGRTARDARSVVGYLTQAFSLYPDLSVEENLRYVGELRRLSRGEIEERGPMRLAEVLDAQKAVLATARKLSDAGTILLSGRGDDYV